MLNTLTFIALVASAFAAPTLKPSINTTVDLGYSKYLGTNNGNGVTSWLGIRYAAPPLQNLRFRAPQSPIVNDTLQIANQVCTMNVSYLLLTVVKSFTARKSMSYLAFNFTFFQHIRRLSFFGCICTNRCKQASSRLCILSGRRLQWSW